jgi:hypothetical protein
MGLFDFIFGKRKPATFDRGAALNFEFESQMNRMEEETSELSHQLMYMIQHVTLREAAFQNHPELVRELAGEKPTIPLLHFISKGLVRCQMAGLVDDDDEMEALMDYTVERFVQAETTVYPSKQHGFTAYLFNMPEPINCPECFFVEIVHRDDELHEFMHESPSTRYFTLEKPAFPTDPIFCEWDREGKHLNYGECTATTLGSFANYVLEKVGR